jgi:hypothetical protein
MLSVTEFVFCRIWGFLDLVRCHAIFLDSLTFDDEGTIIIQNIGTHSSCCLVYLI